MRGIFGEVTDNRTPVNKTKLDAMKLECFNKILDNSHRYYEEFDTFEGIEYEFDSEGFGEWVEEQIVEFHNLKEGIKMSNYHTILFKSRNKDNKHLEGFKERSKTFLSDKPVEELITKFKQFAEEGIEGELSRFYRSVNSRDIKKANTKLVHYLIDNPELPPHKLQTKLVSLASEKDCAVENKWLFDYDYDENGTIQEFVKDVSMHVDESKIRIHPTVSGFSATVNQGFDTRELLKKWENVSLHRDGQLLLDYRNK